jgi:predicted transcriptional regulator
METQDKEIIITFRASAELKKSLSEMASADNRTLSNLIKHILEQAIKKNKGK